jgi:hypothetical protein
MNLLSKKFPGRVVALFATLFTLIFSHCDSPLSDIEVTDPGLLITNFVVERALLDDGTVLGALNTTILDKNFGSVELRNAQVKVNGQQMALTEILNIKTYYIPSPTVNLDTKYDFEMVLADGQSYRGSVTTQAKTFTSITVPSNPSTANDLIISWNDVYAHDTILISLNLTSSAGTVPGATFELTAAQIQAGTFTIPKSTFTTPAGITSALITVTGVGYGTIDSKFRSGSGTISRMRVEKKITFN